MSDNGVKLDRAAQQFDPPPMPFDDVRRRYERQRRNQRLAALGVGLAIGAVAILVASRLWISAEQQPASHSPAPMIPGTHNGEIDVVGCCEASVLPVTSDGVGHATFECAATCSAISGAAWSPDGRLLAIAPRCTGDCTGESGIRVVDPKAGTSVQIASGEPFGGIAWSRDGTRLAFFLDGGLYIARPDASGGRVVPGTRSHIPGGPGLGSSPTWSPDGQRLAYADLDAVDGRIYTINRDGSDKVRIARGQAVAWSPDGARLVVVRCDFVLTMAPDGNDREVAFELPRGHAPGSSCAGEAIPHVLWSPDGRQIAILFGDQLVTLRADGTHEGTTEISGPSIGTQEGLLLRPIP